jgi:hypothetical protein
MNLQGFKLRSLAGYRSGSGLGTEGGLSHLLSTGLGLHDTGEYWSFESFEMDSPMFCTTTARHRRVTFLKIDRQMKDTRGVVRRKNWHPRIPRRRSSERQRVHTAILSTKKKPRQIETRCKSRISPKGNLSYGRELSRLERQCWEAPSEAWHADAMNEALFLYPVIPPFHNHTEYDQSATALTENIAYGAQ